MMMIHSIMYLRKDSSVQKKKAKYTYNNNNYIVGYACMLGFRLGPELEEWTQTQII